MLNLTLERGRFSQLEALRGFTALYVVLHHATSHVGLSAQLALPFRFGQEAVALFFLISGFAVHHSYRGDAKRYIRARLSRIYPVLLAALLITYAASSWAAGRPLAIDGRELLGNLLMLQSRDGAIQPFMGNTPLWTLAFEAFFYAAYLPLMRGRHPFAAAFTIASGGLLLLLATELHVFRLAAYLAIWWTGAALCEAQRGRTGPLLVGMACLAVATATLLVRAVPFGESMGVYPILELRHFAAALVGCVGLLAWSKLRWQGFGVLIGPFATLAPISYALYACHYPLMKVTRLMNAPQWAELAAVMALSLAAAWLIEAAARPGHHAHLIKRTRLLFGTVLPTGTAAIVNVAPERPETVVQ